MYPSLGRVVVGDCVAQAKMWLLLRTCQAARWGRLVLGTGIDLRHRIIRVDATVKLERGCRHSPELRSRVGVPRTAVL
jgi:hypothetical protein